MPAYIVVVIQTFAHFVLMSDSLYEKSRMFPARSWQRLSVNYCDCLGESIASSN